jgi:xanthine dehydrogenase YagS FAD-binding subunit
MKAFEYRRPSSVEQAIADVQGHHAAKFLGGGTNLIDLMKMGAETPAQLIDISRLPLNNIEAFAGGVRIGALARNSAIATNPLIRSRYPVLADAVLAGASPQIRNMATAGGNLLQRTRCYYFYDPSYSECNKRTPGSGCAALQGYNRNHAILGTSDQCIASHPSDMAVALAVLNASIEVRGPAGERSIAIGEFHRLPGSTPDIDTVLGSDELITSIDLPAAPPVRHSYLKVRDRQSYAFALVSVAALVELDASGRIQDARFALGGVAPKPWRVPEAEAMLRGKRPTGSAFGAAAELALRGARPLRYNGFKVELARRSIVRALSEAAQVG